MENTSLIIGGFSQPGVARTLIEQSGSIETGLAQRFMWLFPKPSYAKFQDLEAVDEGFAKSLGKFHPAIWFLFLVVTQLYYLIEVRSGWLPVHAGRKQLTAAIFYSG